MSIRLALIVVAATASIAHSAVVSSGPPKNHPRSCEYLRKDVMSGKAHFISTDGPTEYLSPDMSSCGVRYTDHSAAACVNPGWLGHSELGSNKAGDNTGCFRFIQLENADNHQKAFAQVLDTCGAVINSSFSCHDLILTKDIFTVLAGGDSAKALDDGHISSTINWKYVNEPCESCWTGEFGRTPDGVADTCQGPDPNGIPRCGRKKGADRITSRDKLQEVCHKDYQCPV